MKNEISKEIIQKANEWLNGNYDEATKQDIKDMLENDHQRLIESFYKNLEFGTGGLRGIMGTGSNRMNKYTVGKATQGLANYLIKMFPDDKQIKAVIAYDCRNNNTFFANITANVLSANGIKVYLFDDLRPTPELSFAIRQLNCNCGVMITASHNPKEYNGYKAYWNDGGQLINPHDINVIKEVNNIKNIDDVKFEGNPDLIEIIGKNIDEIYLQKIKELSLSQDIIKKQNNIKIVYTPLHGTGLRLVPESLKNFGFTNINIVEEQAVADGNFPTVVSPNPEEPEALTLAIKKAKAIDADIVMATDPDADRVGIAIKDKHNNFVLLNGNQTASLLIYYLIRKWKENNKLTGNEFIVKTIVTSELLKEIALKNNVECFDVLTGFKFIVDIIKRYEGKKTFIGGGEESYGYLVGDFVRDKDAVISCSMIAELTAWAKENNFNLIDLLIDIYYEFGFYKEKLISVVKKGKSGTEEIQKIMSDFRDNPPEKINNSTVIRINDYLIGKEINLLNGNKKSIDLPKSNVLQFFLEDESKITVRPSGTEPKIKFYFGVFEKLNNKDDFEKTDKILEEKLKNIIKDLNIN
ncbi:MAG: phospho-sugar mutase [Bacteroidales bacterium]|nr:phospho-sugar mutase [Bacteroidales bacterium]